jgi:hypothetical protein
MPTVAVASSNGILYIACDKIEITREGIKSVLESTGYIDFLIIKNDKTNNKLHAEMKLLSKINHGIDGKFMGVSKPMSLYTSRLSLGAGEKARLLSMT